MKRRDFLKFIGAGGIGTGLGILFGQAIKPPGSKLIPYLIPPEDVIPGLANWYASLCTQCSAGCGVLVKVMDGRAKKVEGNPLHPVSGGKLCVRGQSGVQTLYNPDRITGPLKRKGARGSNSFEPISWDEAISEVSGKLKELSSKGEADKLYLLSSSLGGHLGMLADDFMAGFGSSNVIKYDLFDNRNLRYANKSTMGLDAIPHYDIENTQYLLSFGADFTSTWLSPVAFSRGYGEMRQGSHSGRGKFVQVEPRLSLSAANADEWVPAKPGSEAILALAIAREIVESGHYKGSDVNAWKSLLAPFGRTYAAGVTDVDKGRIRKIAKEFMNTRPSLAIGGESISGYSNGVSGLVAVNILNHVAGNLGIEGGVQPNSADLFAGRRADKVGPGIDALIKAAKGSNIGLLFHYNNNPAFTTPGSAHAVEAIKNVPYIASFSSFMDETTALADIILPSHTSFEDWGDDFTDPAPGFQVATLMQPVVSPVFKTRSLGDTIIGLGKGVGGAMATKMPEGTYAEHLKDSWSALYARNKSMNASALTFERFWRDTLAKGGWWKESKPAKSNLKVSARSVTRHISKEPAKFEGDSSQYPLYLIPYAQAGHLDGRGANVPWLQELPDPITSVVWGSWIEINPKTASRLGVKMGDMVTIESPYGKILSPVFVYEGIRPDTVAVPIGQGHKLYGRYAENRGANPLEILPPTVDSRTGAYALNSTRVRIVKTGRPGEMVKMDVSTDELGRGIVQTVPPGGAASKATSHH
jgi:anaerobic selenocysteine-containing dehydrogenase